MGRKDNERINRDTDVHDAETVRLRREGKLLLLTRKEIVTRILDTAIQMWLAEADPLSVHILACVAHRNLDAIATKKGTAAPTLKKGMKWKDLYSAYDDFKHSNGDPDHRDQFVVENNQIMLFDCVASFGSTFSFRTPFMNTFGSYTILHRAVPGDFGVQPKDPFDEFFPSVQLSDVIDLPRKAFVKKMYPLFVDACNKGFF